jgi:hypothetical protein
VVTFTPLPVFDFFFLFLLWAFGFKEGREKKIGLGRGPWSSLCFLEGLFASSERKIEAIWLKVAGQRLR